MNSCKDDIFSGKKLTRQKSEAAGFEQVKQSIFKMEDGCRQAQVTAQSVGEEHLQQIYANILAQKAIFSVRCWKPSVSNDKELTIDQ